MPNRETKRWQHYHQNKAMRAVHKEIKRNREPDAVRRKDRAPVSLDDLDSFYDEDMPLNERVMPKGEQERRKAVLAKALTAIRRDEAGAGDGDQAARQRTGQRAVVIEVSSGQCRVDIEGRELLCRLRGSLTAEETGMTNVVAVGDRVIVEADGAGQGVIAEVLPRRSALARPDVFYSHLKQVIAANVDQLLIVGSWRAPELWLELIDRYLIAAERNGLEPIICVNKIDLAEDASACRAAMVPHLALGYHVVFASAVTGAGVDELRDALKGRTSVVAGMSGVGKSSLLNAIQQGLNLATGAISSFDNQGRHTTTQVTMRRLAFGGYVVDTPGIREFGIAGLRRRELRDYFPDFAQMAGQCRFPDCSHLREPGCAVREAVRRGEVAQTRFHSYAKIYESLPE